MQELIKLFKIFKTTKVVLRYLCITAINKKIKSTSLETSRVESEIRLLKDKQQQLSTILEEKQKVLKGLHDTDEFKNSELDELGRKKQENMEELLMKQRKVKYYDQLKKDYNEII